MANRVLRDWTDSDKINTLSANAERFFTRLIMKVDDYGCFYSDTRLLKANLFPLLLDSIREADLIRWMAECQKADLIVLYEVSNKRYVQIKDFRQRLDRAKSKYPLPDNGSAVIDNDTRAETETKPKLETETNPKQKQEVRENVFLHRKEVEMLQTKFCIADLDWIYDKLSAYKLSTGKDYKSDYGAILTWVVDSLKKEKNSAKKEKINGYNNTSNERLSRQNERDQLLDGLNKVLGISQDGNTNGNIIIDAEAFIIQDLKTTRGISGESSIDEISS